MQQMLPFATNAYPNPLQHLIRLGYSVIMDDAAYYKNRSHNQDYTRFMYTRDGDENGEINKLWINNMNFTSFPLYGHVFHVRPFFSFRVTSR